MVTGPHGAGSDINRLGSADGASVLEVWEHAVRATHSFVSEPDIQHLKTLVLSDVLRLEHLFGVRDEAGRLVGFGGVDQGKMAALFVHPAFHRRGVGRRLVRHAVVELSAPAVDVNEDNHLARAFYRHLGYEVEGRSEVDDAGRPFPLLHMRLRRAAAWPASTDVRRTLCRLDR